MFNKKKLDLRWLWLLFALVSILVLEFISFGMGNEVKNSQGVLSIANEKSDTPRVTLTWDNVSNATSYNLYYSESPGVTKLNGVSIRNVPNPVTLSNLNRNTTYYFVVTAANSHAESGESKEVSYEVK